MVDLRQLQYFVAVSEEGSFVRAATRQHITQSALSQQIARLEREWRVVLFERGVRGAQLTAQGAELLEEAKRVLRDVVSLQARASSLARQEAAVLMVGSATYAVRSRGRQRAVAEFSRAHPEVDLKFMNAWSPQLLRMLNEGELDLAFAMLAPESEQLEYMVMEDEAARLIVPERHWLSRSPRKRVGLSDLNGERVLLHPRSVNSWTFEVMSKSLTRHAQSWLSWKRHLCPASSNKFVPVPACSPLSLGSWTSSIPPSLGASRSSRPLAKRAFGIDSGSPAARPDRLHTSNPSGRRLQGCSQTM